MPTVVAAERRESRVHVAYRIALLLAYVVAALYTYVVWLGVDPLSGRALHGKVNGFDGARVAVMVDGSAPKPYVLRALVPLSVRLLRDALPEKLAGRLEQRLLRTRGLPGLMARLGWEQERILDFAIAVLLMGGFAAGFPVVLNLLAHQVGIGPAWFRDLVPLAAVLGLRLFFAEGAHFLYDMPALFFPTLGLYALAVRRFSLFYAALVLGLLNKETAALLSAVFAVHGWRSMARPAWARHLAAQAAIIVSLRACVLWVFRDNPGVLFEYQLMLNLDRIRSGIDWTTLLILGGFAAALAARWRREAPLLKAASLMPLALTAAYLVVGIYREVRVLYEGYSVIILWCANAAWERYQRSPEAGAPLPRQ